MPSEPERSPAARRLAERALVDLITALGDDEIDLIVLGGLVPEVLVGGQDPPAPPHLGTTDVDLLLSAHLAVEQDLGRLEAALQEIGFAPSDHRWRWRGEVSGTPVKIEFLCDLDDRADLRDVELSGCEVLTGWNLRGTGFVAADWHWQEVEAIDPESGEVSRTRVRFAGLAGYLLAKTVAARTRGAEKDFYDLAYVLLHNRAGGPAQAGGVILDGDLAGEIQALRPTLTEVGGRYAAATSFGPESYANESLRLDPTADERLLRADAVAAVREFLAALT